ncbi:MAG: hypothetical protein IJ783_08580, partial [Kiritimatiellae bacterium]|nr:hypothetical protein [Kiritimatiellia bacterium]
AASARFFAGDAAAEADRFLAEFGGADSAVLVDPPRAGLDRRVAEALVRRPARRLFYVSCAADTLARDLALLCGPGAPYRLASARLFDMFPRTAHFETLCVLHDRRMQ